jgi:hypothetical protein
MSKPRYERDSPPNRQDGHCHRYVEEHEANRGAVGDISQYPGHREEDYNPATAGAVACVRNSCSRISMAAIPRSERTTCPRVTNLRAHLSFNFTNQFIERSESPPGSTSTESGSR